MIKQQKSRCLKSLWVSVFMAFVLYYPCTVMADACTKYDYGTATLHIPSVQIGELFFWMDLKLVSTESMLFRVTDYGEAKSKSAQAIFDPDTTELKLPCIDFKSSRTYGAHFAMMTITGSYLDLVLTNIVENNGDLAINEIVAKDAKGGDDWIEIVATGKEPLNLAEYSIVDEDADHEKASLPSIILNPGDYFVIWATDKTLEDGSVYVPFKLGADDSLILYHKSEIVDAFEWQDADAPEGFSYGRIPDGIGVIQTLTPTPGISNLAVSPTALTRPEGWREESHGKSAIPNYDILFQEGVVKRIDLVFAPEDWQAMLSDMTQLYGEFGAQKKTNEQNDFEGGAPEEKWIIPPEGMVQPDGINERPNINNPGGGLNVADENPVWKPCNIEFEGEKWYFAGARFKGNSSLQSSWNSGIMKLPFRFDFDKFGDQYQEIKDQRFYGFEQLTLASNYRDDSLIREKVVADIFRDAGVPAPRTAFYRLYVDYGEGPIYFGLYTMVEVPSEPMLKSQFSSSDGNLYKPDGTGAAFAIYDETSFDKETNEDNADYSDIKAMYDALHADRQNASVWRDGLEKVFDVNGFLHWLAVNTTIQNWDTYGKMSHNYYLYNDPGDGLIHWIPWDNNEALKGIGKSMMMNGPISFDIRSEEVNDNWPLIRYLIDDPVYHAKYVNFVEATVKNVFYPDRMSSIYKKAHELIMPYVTGDLKEEPGYTFLSRDTAFDTELDYLINHVESRLNDAQDFLTLNK